MRERRVFEVAPKEVEKLAVAFEEIPQRELRVPKQVWQYLKNKYGGDFEKKFVEDVFKDVAPVLERLADEFIRLVEGGEVE